MIDSTTSAESLARMQSMIVNFCRLEDGTLLNEIDLRQYGVDSGQAITNSIVQELAAIHPSIKKLDLTNCHEVSDVGVWSIARHCVTIEHLILRGCNKITNGEKIHDEMNSLTIIIFLTCMFFLLVFCSIHNYQLEYELCHCAVTVFILWI